MSYAYRTSLGKWNISRLGSTLHDVLEIGWVERMSVVGTYIAEFLTKTSLAGRANFYLST